MEPIIVPAIIAKTQAELDEMLESLRGHARRVMLDVMDGRFVPSSSLGFDFKLPHGFEYEAHLMVEGPIEWVRRLAGKVQRVIIHSESPRGVEKAIKKARVLGLRVAMALNPETSLSAIEPYLEDLDGVLVMTVVPGGYGGGFIPEALEKVREVREQGWGLEVEVDGGMNPQTARMALEAGANVIASGSYVMKSVDVEAAIAQLKMNA